MASQYTHFGTQVSLFSGKTRAYLNYKNIPFKEVLPSSATIKNELYPATSVRVIPVVKTPDGDYLQDTTHIIDSLEAQFPESSVYPTNPLQKFLALLLELYGDEWLLLPAMHYRWHYKKQNLWFVLKEFGATAVPHWPRFLQPVFAMLPAFYFGRLYKPVLGISDQNYKQVEAFYEQFLQDFSQHLQQQDFLFGSQPSIADFGFIGPLYAHLYRDPYSGTFMKQKAPKVAAWVERMLNLKELPKGAFSDQSSVPKTLIPILQHMLNTQYPVLHETVKRVSTRIQEKSEQRLPRFLGQMDYQLEGITEKPCVTEKPDVTEKRYVNTYAQWMWQRPLNYFYSLPAVQRDSIIKALQSCGLQGLIAPAITHQIERVNNKLYPVKKGS